jgi:hypothetical protein
MAKQPARLADFEIPRGEGPLPDASVVAQDVPPPAGVEVKAPAQVEAVDDQVPALPPAQPLPTPDVVPMRIAPRPVAEARQAMTIRLPVSMHERLRILMFTSRRSQQQIVEDALNAFLKANQI